MPLTTKFGLVPVIAAGDVAPSPQSIVAAKSLAESLESALNVATVPPTGVPVCPENELPPDAEMGSTVMPEAEKFDNIENVRGVPGGRLAMSQLIPMPLSWLTSQSQVFGKLTCWPTIENTFP